MLLINNENVNNNNNCPLIEVKLLEIKNNNKLLIGEERERKKIKIRKRFDNQLSKWKREHAK